MKTGASVTATETVDPRSHRVGWLLALLLTAGGMVVAAVGMSPDLDGPWQRGWKAHNGGRYALIARNYARWGFTHAGGAPLMDMAPAPGQEPPADGAEPYAHHPPGVMMVTGMLFKLLGPSERLARLLSFVATLASLVVLALLVGTVWTPLAGGVAALLCGATPMTVVFGTHVEVQGPLVLLCGLATLLAYARLLDGGARRPWLLAWMVALGLASWFDWFGLYYGAGCAAHALLTRRGPWLWATLGGWVVALFGGWLAWLSNLPGMSWRRVLGAAGVRVDGGVGAMDGAIGEALGPWFASSMNLVPLWPLLLAVLFFSALRPGSSRSAPGLGVRWLLLLLLAPPLVHCLLFPAGMLLHSYWLFALPPALAAGLALGLAQLRPGVCLAAAVLGAAGLFSRLDLAAEHIEILPSMVGQSVEQHTAPGDGVLTNFEVNVLWDGMEVGDYIVSRPEISYYADRPVRGGIRGHGQGLAVDLTEALRLLPSARWFVLWPDPDDPALPQALDALGGPPPLPLSGDPVVLLYRLRP